jgi:predicted dinucleotide-binding enzyme
VALEARRAGTGQVGTLLARAFHADRHDVVVLSRRPVARMDCCSLTPMRILLANALSDTTAFVGNIRYDEVY